VQSIYVGNLSFSTTDEKFKNEFERFGTVISSKIIKDRETGRSRGFGFVEMSLKEAKEAVNTLDGLDVDGRNWRVSLAEDKKNNNNSSHYGNNDNKFNNNKFNDNKFNDNKFNDNKFNDNKFNDNKFNDNKFNDNKFNDNKFNDNKFNDNKFNDNNFHEMVGIKPRGKKNWGRSRRNSNR